MTTYTVPVDPDQIRTITDPNNPSIKTLHALVNVRHLPLDISLSPDPRVPKSNRVVSRVVSSLSRWDGIFHILNRGITISAKRADYDNRLGSLKLVIPEDDDNYGILDGGHTKHSIKTVLEQASPTNDEMRDQYVHLEVLLGVEDILGQIASARNFSEKVKEITLANYQKHLDWLKQAVGKYAADVRWRENDQQEFDALELIQILAAVNATQFGPTNHPIEAYKNAGKCLDYIIEPNDRWGYRKLEGIVLDVWRLYDTIRYEWWRLYNLPDEQTGRRGRAGRTAEVQARKRGKAKLMRYVTLGINGDPADGDKHVEKGLAIPLLAGFRALLEPRPDGNLYWTEDPFSFFERHGQSLVSKVMDASDQRDHNPHTVGRDKTVYAQIYDAIELARLREQLRDTTVEALAPVRNPRSTQSVASTNGTVITHTNSSRAGLGRAEDHMSADVSGGKLRISFAGGAEHVWKLPAKQDTAAIRAVRSQAVEFGKENGASDGQLAAIKKALTSNGYYLIGPQVRRRRAHSAGQLALTRL